jgi:hypothetical protein
MQLITKISNFFYLEEFLRSEAALRHQIKEQFNPPQEIIQNLAILAKNAADPIRIAFGSFTPDSGYRCPRLNEIIGGTKNSEHLKGLAFDENFSNNKKVFNWILNGGIKRFSKLIYYYPDEQKDFQAAFLHIGYDFNNLKNQVFIAKKVIKKTKVENMFIPLDKYEFKNQILNN